MEKVFAFERLIVYEKSLQLVKDIYAITKLFPETEKFGLCSQLQRAIISVPSNIA
ncbi:MAG: four helix bundle protein, partial [Muribaculaceae bacterium]|nr:four helix bundle protein [Muribaculaceae bacterium]